MQDIDISPKFTPLKTLLMREHPSILFLTQFYPTSAEPYHGIYFRDHAEALAEYADVSVMVVKTPSFRQNRSFSLELDYSERRNVKTLFSTKPVLSHRFSNRIRKAERTAVLEGFDYLIGQIGHKPDMIIAQCALPSGTWARWIFEEFRIPYATIEHFTFLERMLKEQKDEMGYVYERSTFIATVSTKMKDLLLGYGYGEPLTFRLGNVLGREFEREKLDPQKPEKKFKWLFVGPDMLKKGIEVLGEVFAQLDRNDWELTIIGSGSYQDVTKHEQISDSIKIINGLDRRQMIQQMKSHDALISTSHIETFGMAVLEMLSLGKPVVSTRSGGPEDFVTSKHGELCNPGDIDALKSAVSHIMDNYSSYNNHFIRQSIVEQYGSSAYANKLLSEIKDRISR